MQQGKKGEHHIGDPKKETPPQQIGTESQVSVFRSRGLEKEAEIANKNLTYR